MTHEAGPRCRGYHCYDCGGTFGVSIEDCPPEYCYVCGRPQRNAVPVAKPTGINKHKQRQKRLQDGDQ